MGFRRILKSGLAQIVGAIAALGGAAALVYKLVEDVRIGRGVDHYIAMSGQEWSAIPALVMIGIATTILVVGGILRWAAEAHEEHDFLSTIRRRMSIRRTGAAVPKGRGGARGRVP
jgi:hypothetical protein